MEADGVYYHIYDSNCMYSLNPTWGESPEFHVHYKADPIKCDALDYAVLSLSEYEDYVSMRLYIHRGNNKL